MPTIIEQLKDVLPSLESMVIQNLSKKTANEFSGPCPFCGGDDRFTYCVDSDRGFCRQCEWKGDTIQYHQDTLSMDLKQLAAEYLPQQESVSKTNSGKKKLLKSFIHGKRQRRKAKESTGGFHPGG